MMGRLIGMAALAGMGVAGCTGDTIALGHLPLGAGADAEAVDGAVSDATSESPAAEAGWESSVDTGDAGCGTAVLPSGPFGVDVGDVLDPALQWPVAPGGNPAELGVGTYFEPHACIGIRALVIIEVGWDSASDAVHASCISAIQNGSWGARVRVLELVSTAIGGGPATAADAAAWKQAKSSPLPVGADPARTLFLAPSEQPPIAVVVDPCTLRVSARYGAGDDLAGAVAAIASQPACSP